MFDRSGGAGKVCGGQGQYSLARAQQSFKSLVQIHEKNGKILYNFTTLFGSVTILSISRLVYTSERGWLMNTNHERKKSMTRAYS